MKRWISKLATNAFNRRVRARLEAKEYGEALDMTSTHIQGNEDSELLVGLHAAALIGLERYEDAISVIDNGNFGLKNPGFAIQKCRSLFGANRLEELKNFADLCRSTFGKQRSSFSAYSILASDLGTPSKTDVGQLLEDLDSIEEPWEIVTLWKALNSLDMTHEAAKVASVVESRFPGTQL